MKTRTKFGVMSRALGVLLAISLFIPLSSFYPSLPAASADSYGQLDKFLAGDPATGAMGAVQTGSIAMLIKYVGSAGSGKVAVDAGTGDLTMTVGAQGSETTDATFECPVSGGLGGVVDVSDAACNTMGEVVDSINSSANWRAVIIDGLRTDSSNDTMVTFAATAATAENGLAIYYDNAVVNFDVSIALGWPRKMSAFLATQGTSPSFRPNPMQGRQVVVLAANGTTTYASGASAWEILSATQKLTSGGTAGVGTTGASTVTTIYSTPAGGSTTNSILLGPGSTGGMPYGIRCNPDEKCLVRINNSAVMSAAVLYAYGINYKY